MDFPLSGRTIAMPETGELAGLASLLEARGAATVRCPMAAAVEALDPAPVSFWLDDLIDGRFDDVIFTTGEGVRRLLERASRENRLDEVRQALARTRTIARGAKPALALQNDAGVTADVVAAVPTSDGIIEALDGLELRGRCVGLQLVGQEPDEKILSYLEARSAIARCVWPYALAPASDERAIVELIDRMAREQIDAIAFTNESQVSRLTEVAERHGRRDDLRYGLQRVRIAAAEPMLAEALQGRGYRVDVVRPGSGSMQFMARQIAGVLARQDRAPLRPSREQSRLA